MVYEVYERELEELCEERDDLRGDVKDLKSKLDASEKALKLMAVNEAMIIQKSNDYYSAVGNLTSKLARVVSAFPTSSRSLRRALDDALEGGGHATMHKL